MRPKNNLGLIITCNFQDKLKSFELFLREHSAEFDCYVVYTLYSDGPRLKLTEEGR